LGDSHEHDDALNPFDKTEIDDLVLEYLRTFLSAPELRIASHWNGVYSKHQDQYVVVVNPLPRVTVVTGVGGAGMTLSFGLAEQVVRAELDAVDS
jgi:glycine/D-amino acid oxidase-like deaminating enzyme